jgi:predicted deacylase
LNRRNFLLVSSALFFPKLTFAKSTNHIVLPPKPFEYFYKKGKGKRILIIGGIHGNEMGAYKAADLLVNMDIKADVLIIPRSNFTSILANVRGYNGDMNRKFDYISKRDPDFYYVELLKAAILDFKPDLLISMHDGYGFNFKNSRAWGQSVVIDEIKYKNFELFKEAKTIKDNANKYLKWPVSIINTKTFSGTIHKEQKKALTGWCLKHNIKAFCIEASKQLPTLKDKIYTHLIMIREFFKLYGIKSDIDYYINNLNIKSSVPIISMKINNNIYKINKNTTIKLSDVSDIRVIDIQGDRGSFIVPKGVNLNWRKFYFKNLILEVKNDFETKYKIFLRS